MRCAALARSTGERCKNEAGPDGFCDTASHHRGAELAPGALEELEELGGARAAADPPEPTQPEPRRADFSPPDDLEDVPLEVDPLAGLAEAPGPELDPLVRGDAPRDPSVFQRIPDDLFAELEEAAAEGGAPPGTPAPEPAGVETRWTGDACVPLVRTACNPLFERHGKDALHDVEAELGGEVVAAWINQYMSALDPANPSHLLAFWVAIVFGPRYLPDVAAAARRKLGKQGREIVRDGERRNGSAPPPPPDEQEADDLFEQLGRA